MENVLSARDPSLTDENDWEEFALTDVKVHLPGKLRYANILSASATNPVNVTGLLELVEEEQQPLGMSVIPYSARRVRFSCLLRLSLLPYC